MGFLNRGMILGYLRRLSALCFAYVYLGERLAPIAHGASIIDAAINPDQREDAPCKTTEINYMYDEI
jgi:hypothetical protein